MKLLGRDFDRKLDAFRDLSVDIYEDILPHCINPLDAHNKIAQYLQDILSIWESEGKNEKVIPLEKYLIKKRKEKNVR